MSKSARRILIPLFISAVALGIVALVMLNPRNRGLQSSEQDAEVRDQQSESGDQGAQPPQEGQDAGPEDASSEGLGTDQEETAAAPDTEGDQQEGEDDPDEAAPTALAGLRAVAPGAVLDSTTNPPGTIGSLDWRAHRFLIEFSPAGAGIERITFNNIWETAAVRREAAAVMQKVEQGDITLAEGLSQLPGAMRYVVQKPRAIDIGGHTWEVPAFAFDRIVIDSDQTDPQSVSLWEGAWSQVEATGGTSQSAIAFATEIQNDAGEPVVRITRQFTIGLAAYDLVVEQRFENLTAQPLDITLYTYGMSDLDADRAQYIDRRRIRIGHLIDTQRYPERTWVETDDDFFLDRSELIEVGQRNFRAPSAANALWPNEVSAERNYELSWFALENRYFAVAIHPAYEVAGTVRTSLAEEVAAIESLADPALEKPTPLLMTRSPVRTIPPSETLALDVGIYAGPLDRSILSNHEPYDTLKLGRLIIYRMSDMCAWCTFQWLAVLLLWFLSLGHSVFFDWGIAIILLVVVVRLALHPITKKSQVSMQRFGKVMQKLKPDIEKLQEKYRSDPKRLQQEQMKLWKEYGVSPFSCLGFLPLFLQMPIWVALYAMLYFAWELRHEAAFWGVFQMLGGWPFLGDLSSGDHFFYEFAEPYRLFGWINLTGLNLLPILMGAIFWVQQKYMTPQMANMSPEQKQMQTMMRVMTVFLFPIMLYTAPSGLTMYIMTSSIWGILESRHVRKHVEKMEIEKPIERKTLEERMAMKAKTKAKDPYARAMQMAMDRAKAKREAKEKKSFKKRK